jgi:hypothetical protein
MKCKFIFLITIFFSYLGVNAQSPLRQFSKVSHAERVWAVLHPCCAIKAFHISQHVLDYLQKMPLDSINDGDGNGGNLDAFRHMLWMSSLSQKIGKRRALSLGRAHERGDKQFFNKKRKSYDGELPDQTGSEMDLKNNLIGVDLGLRLKGCSEQTLADSIRQLMASGKVWRIKKDTAGNFYDIDGNKIDLRKYQGKWQNPKCLMRTGLTKEFNQNSFYQKQ